MKEPMALSKGATGDSDGRSGEGRKGKEPPLKAPAGGGRRKAARGGGRGGEAAGKPGEVRSENVQLGASAAAAPS